MNQQYEHWALRFNTLGAKRRSSSVDQSIEQGTLWTSEMFSHLLERKRSWRSRLRWILSRYAVRADGRTGYLRVKGREYTPGTEIYKLPKTAYLTKLDDRWRTAIWLGKSDRSDEHIIGLDTGAVLARSVRRKAEGKRWNERALKMVTGTPWNPSSGEVVARRRYITRALVERYDPTEDCGACFRKSQQHTERGRARLDLLLAGEDGPVEARAQEEQSAPLDPAAPSLISTSTAPQTGGVDTDVMESEDIELAVSSRQTICHGR